MAEQKNHTSTQQESPAHHATTGANGSAQTPEAELNQFFDQAQDWIKENQTLAMLGGFGFGVFIGVLLRR